MSIRVFKIKEWKLAQQVISKAKVFNKLYHSKVINIEKLKTEVHDAEIKKLELADESLDKLIKDVQDKS